MSKIAVIVLTLVLIALSAMLFIIGAVFKIQHWPYGQQIIYMSVVGVVSSILIFIFQRRKIFQ